MRRLTSFVLLALLPLALLGLALLGLEGSAAAAADAPIGVRKPMPKSLSDLESRLDDLGGRIRRLLEAANRDPAQKKIEIYKRYKPKELKKIRGRVRAEDLVAFMVDSEKDFATVRKPAKQAILDGGQFKGDPELSNSEKAGSRTRRSQFCDRKLIGYLKSSKVDRFARALVNELLVEWYPRAKRTISDIKIYNPDNDKSWKAAYNAWDRFLKKN